MDALLLHLDEELYTPRPGRAVAPYSPGEIALLVQLYSILFDRVFVPANFLIDSRMTRPVLELLRVQDRASAVHATSGGLRILWDTSRFACETFAGLRALTAADTAYRACTDRVESEAAAVATVADAALLDRVEYANMRAELDPTETVAQLRHEVFNPALNVALPADTLRRCAACLDRLESAAGDIGYSRVFFYSAFGFGDPATAKRFRRVIGAHTWAEIRHPFLAGVDYVSHRLKAHLGGQALGRTLDILFPPEQLRAVLRPDKATSLAGLAEPNRSSGVALHVGRPPLLRPEHLLSMSAEQLDRLHASPEYARYKAACRQFRQGIHPEDRAQSARHLESALQEYLQRVAATLNPGGVAAGRVLRLLARAITTPVSFAAFVALEHGHVPHEEAEGVAKIVEAFVARYTHAPVERFEARNTLDVHTLQLGEDIRLYLK